jgi:hypothetical protein
MPIRATVHQSGYRIFQLKNPFIPDFALSENGAVRRYSPQWASGFAGSRARNIQARDNGPQPRGCRLLEIRFIKITLSASFSVREFRVTRIREIEREFETTIRGTREGSSRYVIFESTRISVSNCAIHDFSSTILPSYRISNNLHRNLAMFHSKSIRICQLFVRWWIVNNGYGKNSKLYLIPINPAPAINQQDDFKRGTNAIGNNIGFMKRTRISLPLEHRSRGRNRRRNCFYRRRYRGTSTFP